MLGAAGEPVENVWPVVQEEMPGIRHELEFGAREVCSEVLAVGARYEHVQIALPEPHVGRNIGELEAPRLGEGEVVVDPATAAPADRLDEGVSDDRPDPGPREHGLVGSGELRGKRVEQLVRSLLIVST